MRIYSGSLLLVGALLNLYAAAQTSHAGGLASTSRGVHLEITATYDAVSANVVAGRRFWIQGGSLQLHGQFWRGLGVVADIAGAHGDSVGSSAVDLDLITATFGPRYTFFLHHKKMSIFGQALAGEGFGLHSVFPGPLVADSSADGLALKLGGGVNFPLTHRVGLRAFEFNLVHTQLPNSTSNVQNNLQLGTGITFNLGRAE